jgi:hypothetical protein
MSFINFLRDFIGINFGIEEDETTYDRECSTTNPLILSLRKVPRDQMEEPEVEYIPIPVDNNNIDEGIIDAEVLK